MDSIIQQLYDDLADVAVSVRQSLVQITNGRGGVGAGTIWHPDGLIVTNAHVISGHGELHVILPAGDSYRAQILAQEPNLDLAALSIPAANLPVIEPGDSRALKAGQWVMALGHPFGVLNSVTGGVVIGMGQQLGDIQFRNGVDWLAVNLRLRPGHSGGPLVDSHGRLIGVNTIMNGPEVGVAIPVHVVKAFLKQHLGAQQKQAV
jgi:S1-C subfamily serine protease